jgi:hypothetical protein
MNPPLRRKSVVLKIVKQAKSIHWLTKTQLSVGFRCSRRECRKNTVFLIRSEGDLPIYLCHSDGLEYARENELDPGPRPHWIQPGMLGG